MEPEELETKEFLISLRGYDREEVDSFLKDVAQQMREVKSALASSSAGPPAMAAASAAPSPVGREDALKKVGEETSKILLAAEQVGEDIKTKAREEAAELLADARQEAEKIHRQIQQDRQIAEEDLRKLKEARAVLATQLEDVRRRLDETIARLTAPMDSPAPTRPARRPDETKEVAAKAPPKVDEPKTAPPPVASTAPVVSAPPAAPPVEQQPAVDEPVADPGAAQAQIVLDEPAASPEKAPEPQAPEPEPEADESATLASLLDQIRREREEGAKEVEEALAAAGASTPAPAPTAPAPEQPTDPLAARDSLLGDLPEGASRRMKRLLQEDQNDLLDRIRTGRGKGSVDENIPSEQEQMARFEQGLLEVLGEAFTHGRKLAGADEGDAAKAVSQLVSKQLVTPLRTEVIKVVEAGLAAQDTATAIAERASDIFRVWKGVRTELLGEGMTYAAFHQGLLDAWGTHGAATKRWILAPERDCPREVCRSNADAGPVGVGAPFPSGHTAPPAHGGCTCTMSGPEG